MSHSREELIGFVDTFLDALADNDPSRLPVTADVRYTENCQTLALGKGMWATATPHKPEKHFLDVVDPASGQVVYFGVARENHNPSILSVRLKVRDGLVAEIEVLVARQPDASGHPRVFNPGNMVEPRPGFFEMVPEAERSTPEELLRRANLYLDGIIAGDGSMIPVADDCVRIENGTQTVLTSERGTETAKLGVAAQVNTGIFRDIEAARERRFPIVDIERGLVSVIFLFDHPGPMTNSGFTSRYTQPNSMMVSEVFKVRDHRIVQIEAVLNVFPYGTRSGWD
jgi:hypothetical protein